MEKERSNGTTRTEKKSICALIGCKQKTETLDLQWGKRVKEEESTREEKRKKRKAIEKTKQHVCKSKARRKKEGVKTQCGCQLVLRETSSQRGGLQTLGEIRCACD